MRGVVLGQTPNTTAGPSVLGLLWPCPSGPALPHPAHQHQHPHLPQHLPLPRFGARSDTSRSPPASPGQAPLQLSMPPLGYPPPKPARIVIQNVSNRETVYQRLLLVLGFVEGFSAPEGTLLVTASDPQGGQGKYDPHVWQVNHGHFKALVPLSPGPNELTFQLFGTPFTHASQILSYAAHGQVWEQREPSVVQQSLSVWYQRDRGTPPLHLAILVARDSPALRAPDAQARSASQGYGSGPGLLTKLGRKVADRTAASVKGGTGLLSDQAGPRALVDAPPGEQRERLRQLGEVQRRFALQAYLWQAFHAEQMHRMGLGRRTFSLDDGAADDSPAVAGRRRDVGEYARVHILVSEHSVREFLEPDNAQQYPNAKNGGAMHTFAREALSSPQCPRTIRDNLSGPVAVLILDTQWDPSMPLLRAHAAVGSADPGGLSFGVMGSHWIWAAPAALDAVTEAMQNYAQTDERYCVNDLKECDYAFETLNIGSGAFLHEVGHALNNPHWPHGIMLRGYVEWNRAFMTREGARSKRHSPGEQNVNPITPANDSGMNHLHRLQAVRGRWHPTQLLPTDPPLPYYDPRQGLQAYEAWRSAEPIFEPSPEGIEVKAACGIGALEIYTKSGPQEGGDGDLVTHVEFTGLPPQGHAPPSSLTLDAKWLSSLVGFDVKDRQARIVRINIVGCNLRQTVVDDYRGQAGVTPIHLPGVPFALAKGFLAGGAGQGPERLHVFRDTYQSSVYVASIVVHAGAFVDGLEVVYSDGVRWGELWGGGGSAYRFDLYPEEHLSAIHVRSGAWLDAIQLVLTSGRKSAWYGGTGGGERTLEIASGGFFQEGSEKGPVNVGPVAGIYGSTNGWLFSLGLLRRL